MTAAAVMPADSHPLAALAPSPEEGEGCCLPSPTSGEGGARRRSDGRVRVCGRKMRAQHER